MTTLHQLLTDADPLRDEALPAAARTEAIRRAIAAAPRGSAQRAGGLPRRFVLVAVGSMAVLAMLVVFPMWTSNSGTVHAAMQFEVRLADTEPGPEMRAVSGVGSHETIYLHPQVLLTNSDIASAQTVALTEGVGVEVELTAIGAARMRVATANNVGRLLAIMVDGSVLAAPRIAAPIADVGLITGDFSMEEATRLAEGMRVTPQAERVRVGGDIPAPAKVTHVAPVYPDSAKELGIQGIVILEIVVATDGRVLDASVVRSVPELEAAAITAVSQWDYEPAFVNGEPVELVMTVVVNFYLGEQPAR